jgi:hypothetical protein
MQSLRTVSLDDLWSAKNLPGERSFSMENVGRAVRRDGGATDR